MPNLLYSQQEAELLHNRGFEIILHMPVKAKNGRPAWLGSSALTTIYHPKNLKPELTTV